MCKPVHGGPRRTSGIPFYESLPCSLSIVSHHTQTQAPAILLSPSPQSSGLTDVQPLLAFYLGSGDLNSHPHDCTEVLLSAEPSSHPTDSLGSISISVIISIIITNLHFDLSHYGLIFLCGKNLPR